MGHVLMRKTSFLLEDVKIVVAAIFLICVDVMGMSGRTPVFSQNSLSFLPV